MNSYLIFLYGVSSDLSAAPAPIGTGPALTFLDRHQSIRWDGYFIFHTKLIIEKNDFFSMLKEMIFLACLKKLLYSLKLAL